MTIHLRQQLLSILPDEPYLSVQSANVEMLQEYSIRDLD